MAAQARCQELVVDFLGSGGRIGRDIVSYRNVAMPRRFFTGKNLGGVFYLKQVAEYGATIDVNGSDRTVVSLRNGLRFESDRDGFIDTLCMISERFVADEYRWLEPEGRVVIDVGANIADSVLYFVKRGAAYVYGYEPEPAAFATAIRNLRANGISNAEVKNVAVRGSRETARDGAVTLDEIVGEARSEHPGLSIVCKIDCEGCEFEIVRPGAESVLSYFHQVMIEYHWRSPQPIVQMLEASGFSVETSLASAPGVGWIRATQASKP